MELLLSESLTGWAGLYKSESQTSEVRGGKYAARVQIGIEKDGSPKYRYFKTQEEYESYMKGSGKANKKKQTAEKTGKTLKEKQEKERKDSKKKQESLMTAQAKKKKEVETTEKSLSLYLEVTQ